MTRQSHQLPSKWHWVSLGDLAPQSDAFVDGPFGSNLKTEHYAATGVRVVRLQNIGRGTFLDNDRAFVSPEHFAGLMRHSVVPGDVVVAALGDGARRPAGRACLIPVYFGQGLVKADCFRLRLPKEIITAAYLVYFMNSPQCLARIMEMMRGATRPRVTLGMLRSLSIPLPPLAEQVRIASWLDSAYIAVERARAAAEAQVDAARELLVAGVDELFRSHEAAGWPRRRLGEIVHLRKDVVHPKDGPLGHAVFVGLEHIESHTGRRTGSVEVELEQLTGRKPRFQKGDIVYGYLRPYLNKVWVAEFSGLCSVDQYVYSVVKNLAIPGFVAAFMRTPSYLRAAPVAATPGQLPRIRTDEVAQVPIPLPPLATQSTVLRMIEKVRSVSERLVQAAERRLEETNTLPAALLHQAFRGEL